MAVFSCCHGNRRDVLRGVAGLNGLDWMEVREDSTTPADLVGQPARVLEADLDGRLLEVHFVNSPAPALVPDNFRLDGGDRLRGLSILSVDPGTTADSLLLCASAQGDFSTYTLSVVTGPTLPGPPSGIDPVVRSLDFSFHVGCDDGFDCAASPVCPPERAADPEIDLTARDAAGFQRILLDRLSNLGGRWTDRHEADPGMALVELLAYVGDRLSYRQDAIATEAYLGTARRRISARRHARLLDYSMHDGSSARAAVRILVDASADGQKLAGPDSLGLAGTRILSRLPGVDPVLVPGSDPETRALLRSPAVFETLHDLVLRPAHAEIPFHAWGASECRLPAGATSATLLGKLPDLAPGDLLVFAETVGPRTGLPQDADPSRRHLVRLVSVVPGRDPLGGLFLDPPVSTPLDVTEIVWSEDDALPFALCLSSYTDLEHGQKFLPHVSTAWGNIVLADHGRTLDGSEDLGRVPAPSIRLVPDTAPGACDADPASEATLPAYAPARYRPVLSRGPLTQVARFAVPGFPAQTRPFDPGASAASAFRWTAADVVPALHLFDDVLPSPRHWLSRRDLLGSGETDIQFVAEVDDASLAHLRFGDGEHGLRPAQGTDFQARYRVGTGEAGNVGPGSLASVVCAVPGVLGADNPLPARGGSDPESVAQVRDRAPRAFRVQKRAVTESDYASAAREFPGVQDAAATFRWTGSWTTVFLTVERADGLDLDDAFRSDLVDHLERLRMAGHDLEVEGPLYLPLELGMTVCVDPDHFRLDVERALRAVFTSGTGPDGGPGLFSPLLYTFGQSVFTTRFLAAAQAIEGVSHAEVTSFGPQGDGSDAWLKAGRLDLGRLQLPRLQNDPDFPDRGVFQLQMRGGK
jgi:hypothetical protein